jgi:hypothetical protein
MTGTYGSSAGKGAERTVIVVEVPGGREFVWPSPRLDMVSWQIGERVSYMGSRWRVVSRTNGSSDVLTLRLVPEGEKDREVPGSVDGSTTGGRPLTR